MAVGVFVVIYSVPSRMNLQTLGRKSECSNPDRRPAGDNLGHYEAAVHAS